jgi:hypothetical protein
MNIIERAFYLLVIATMTTLWYKTSSNQVEGKTNDKQFCLEKGKSAKFLINAANNKQVTCYIKYDEQTGNVVLGECGAWE